MTGNERRSKFRVGLSTLYLPIYDALCETLPSEWAPYFGVRTFDEQTALYSKGRSVNPIGEGYIVTYARAGESAHNYGCATDWTFWENGNPLWLSQKDPRWEPYLQAIEKAGGKAGANFSHPDFPHNELPLEVPWSRVKLPYQQGGMLAAQQYIEVHSLYGLAPRTPTLD